MTKTLTIGVEPNAKLPVLVWLMAAALVFAGRAAGWEAPPGPQGAAAVLAGIDVSFKVDPRLTRGLYMGDRWVSAPVFSINQPLKGASVEGRALGKDARGKGMVIRPRWVPGDPEMVAVAPAEGSDVKISVLRVGESRLQVNADGVSRDLTVRATQEGDALSIEISQVTVPADTPAPQAEAKVLPSEKERGSYALGIEFGRRLKQQSMELDAELVSRGLRDALAGGSTLLTEGELKAAIVAMQSRLRETQQREQSELAEQNRKEGEAFLIENRNKEGVVTLESGLQYKVLKAGDGAKPASDDTVVCHYRGTFLDGTEFDSSAKRQKAGSFPLRSVIRGWKEALQLMPVGSKWQLFVPPNLAYGERGSRSRIGPNKTLVFEVELLSIEEASRSAGKTAAPAASQNDTPSGTTVK